MAFITSLPAIAATARHVAADLKQFCRGDGRVRARVRVFEKRKGSRAP